MSPISKNTTPYPTVRPPGVPVRTVLTTDPSTLTLPLSSREGGSVLRESTLEPVHLNLVIGKRRLRPSCGSKMSGLTSGTDPRPPGTVGYYPLRTKVKMVVDDLHGMETT